MKNLASHLPGVAARMGLAFPLVALGARVVESNFGHSTCFGRYCVGHAATAYHAVLLPVLAVGFLAATRTMFAGPSRWMGLVGFLASFAVLLAPAFALEFPALQSLWP